MTYLDLNAERLLGIVDGLNRIVSTSLDPEDVADTAARVARVVAGADGASLEIDTPDAQKMLVSGVMEGAGSKISVPLEYGAKIGTLTVAKTGNDGFTDADQEALKLLAEGIAAHMTHALLYTSVEFESRVDQLTGLGNKLAFEERLGWELSRASRYEEPISLAIFDIDDFGRLNDRFGPEACDEILVEITQMLSQGRAADSFFRVGGDSFAVIMPNTNREGAEIAAIRMSWAIANLREDDLAVTVTAGVTQADIPDPRVFFAAAETALRDARAASFRETAIGA